MSKRLSNKKLGELVKRLYPEKYIKATIAQAVKQNLTQELKIHNGHIPMNDAMNSVYATLKRVINKNIDLLDTSEDEKENNYE